MLIECNRIQGSYRIALNNASGAAELLSDFSFLDGAPAGTLIFDFTHMAAGLTQEMREEYLPGNFGFQPTVSLLEVISTLAFCLGQHTPYPHQLRALFPHPKSRVGRFLTDMEVPTLLQSLGIPIISTNPASTEQGRDDSTRKSLIPLTALDASAGMPDFAVVGKLITRVELVFTEAIPHDPSLVHRFTSIVVEAVDNLLEYGLGGLIGGLYYPNSGEVEITLVNRHGGFGGTTPDEQLAALFDACEGKTHHVQAGGIGIAALSWLALACFGTLWLRNGNATLRLLPDGSAAASTEDTGFSLPGAYITLLLQLLPNATLMRTEDMSQFEEVLERWHQSYSLSKSQRME